VREAQQRQFQHCKTSPENPKISSAFSNNRGLTNMGTHRHYQDLLELLLASRRAGGSVTTATATIATLGRAMA